MKKKMEMFARAVAASWFIGASLIAISVIKDGFPGGASTLTWDALKTVVGPFIGAALAFYANNYFHKQRKADSDLAAAMGALFAVNALHDDFLNYRFAWRHHLETTDIRFGRNQHTAIWLYSKPMVFTFRESGFPNLEALQFLLLSESGREAYHHLQGMERAYRDLRAAHTLLNDATVELQTAYMAAGGPAKEPTAVIEAIGARVLRGVETLLIGVINRIERDELLYRNAYSFLHAAVEEQLGTLSVQGVVQKDKFKAENLPPMPKALEGKY